MPTTLKFFRRNLPHWLVADRSYFVTLRLHGTLPREVVRSLQEEREALLASHPDPQAVLELQRHQFVAVEKILDAAGANNNWLALPELAFLVMENFNWFREKGWRVYVAVVMSTHVHMLMRSESGRSKELLEDLAHFKRFTAKKANQRLGRTGAFWAREDFDHWIRDRGKFEGTVRYILNNPVKAGLVESWEDWEWYYMDESIRELI